jgi:hypothetical protein
MVCFKSHLIVGLGLPPSKFLSATMNFLSCELVHFNPNAIAALSYFTMLCECWLGIAIDTNLFWYYYSPTRYEKVVYSGIGLSVRRHHRKEYINPTFRSSWKNSQQRWIIVDMHVQPHWVNKLLFPPFIDDKQSELNLADLVKRVPELREDGLRACHYAEEFTLQRLRPLGRREKLAYECSWLADPSHEPAAGKIFTLTFYLLMVYFLDLICSVSYIALAQEEIDQLVAHLFDKDPSTPRPAGVPTSFSNDPPPLR